MAFTPQYSTNASGHAVLTNKNQRGNISLGRAKSMYNTAGRVWKAAGQNIMSHNRASGFGHIAGVSMGQGSNRPITSSPDTSLGISSS